MAGAVNTIGQSKRGGGDRSSRPAQLQARENEQKALSLWIKGATFQQIAAAGFGIATASGAWRAVHRALAQIPKQEADQAREAQLARLQAVRMLLWNHAGADPFKAAEALIKLEAREARLRGLDMPTTVAVTDPDRGIPLETIRRVMERVDRQRVEVDVTPSKPAQIDVVGDTSPPLTGGVRPTGNADHTADANEDP
jgi:pimeloyl-ACP methyl ester carboxylesterase